MSNSGAKDRFKRAEQAAKKGNFEYAIELFLQGLTLDPKATQRSRLHQVEALAIEEQGGNPEGSMSARMKTMGILGKVKKHAVQKKWDEQVVELEKAIRSQPRNAALLLQLANALLKIEAEDSAMEVLEEILTVDHHNIEALRRLGQLWSERDPEKSIEYWERLRMVKPEDKEASKAIRDLSAANMVKRAEARKQESGDESFKAMLRDEGKSEELEKKAKVIRTDEDREEAIKFKKQELKAEPQNSRLWRELGALYQDLRQYKYARAAFKKALEVNPQDLFARDKIGALEEKVQQDKLDDLRRQVEEAEQNGGAPAELKQQLETKEREFLEFRTKEYARRVKQHPTDYDLKLEYGKLLMEGGDFDQAIEQFQKAIKDPKFKVHSQNYMGLCFLRKGVHAVAMTQFQEALKNTDPEGEIAKEIRYNLAVAAQQAGDRETALKHFHEIMAVDIGYRDVSTRVEELMKEGSSSSS